MIFNENLARVAEQYLKKGSKVYVEGQLQTRKWQDQSGQEKYTTEIVLQRFRGELTILDSRGGGAGAGDFPRKRGAGRSAAAAISAAPRPWSAGRLLRAAGAALRGITTSTTTFHFSARAA